MIQKQQLKLQKNGETWIARRKGYISCIEKYPLYSILLVLDEYVSKEFYEECIIIKEALDEYNETKVKKNKHLIGDIIFPTNLTEYKGLKFQKQLLDSNIVVEDSQAKEKATLIKLKLPLKKWRVG